MRYSDRYMKKQIGIAIIIGFMFTATGLKAQSERTIVDEVAGIVGGEMVLLSDIETAYLQYKPSMPTITKCEVFDELLFQKLLITQAELDSITVSDAQVDMELDNRIRYFTNQFGSKQKLEEFYGKLHFRLLPCRSCHDHVSSDASTRIRCPPEMRLCRL